MAIVSSGALFDVLRQYCLLSPQHLAEALSLAQGRFADVRALARMLLQRGWFTVYQINQLLAGHGKHLILGPYHILDRLGKGGQSEVYKARHAEFEWTVALKVIRSDYLSTAEAAAQFIQEMEAMAELEHPNIVGFWDTDKADGAYYCAMEFIDGTDLGKVVRLTGCLPPALACDCVRQAALGLQHAHEHNLVHRDIKPVNLFLTQPAAPPSAPHLFSGQLAPAPSLPLIKILDWGLASLRLPQCKEIAVENKHLCHNVVGTADYLSPEQAINPTTVDIRGDIYSLGCTLYYLLSGQVPFNGTTAMQKILQHQKAEPPAVESYNPDVHPALAALVRRMMAKKPEDRFQTPAAVALALTPFCRGSECATPAPRRQAHPRPDRLPDDTPMLSATLGAGSRVVSGR